MWISTLVIALAATSWGAVRGLRTVARRMFIVTEPYGHCRMVADERGAVSTGERVSFSVDWTVYREYLETPGLFVLLSGDRAAARYCPSGALRTLRTSTGSGRAWTGS
ncbi:hypothetical protein [Streptomyces sp. NPDC006334]|uniref:hypothetical protein n=1 Tax=Streptomyces sp. NPDC006334 TaxID=3156754 RepID=UPI0033B90BF4